MASLINAATSGVFDGAPGNDPTTLSRASLLNGATPLAPPPDTADAYAANSKAYGGWVAAQRADGVAKGLLDPETGWPTKAGLEDAANQLAQSVMMGTTAPGMKGATMENPAFAKWFGASKVVDDAGSPLALYHGSAAKNISEFKPSLIGSANDEGYYGRGYYFTPDQQLAQDYVPSSGGAVHQINASVQNPFIWDLSTPAAQADTIARVKAIMPEAEVTTTGIRVPNSRGATDNTGSAQWTAALQKVGHDGVFVMAPGQEIHEAVAFDPRQIKSATANRGTFDSNDPRIKYGLAGLMAGGGAAATQGEPGPAQQGGQ